MFENLENYITTKILNSEITLERKLILDNISKYLKKEITNNQTINLNFICTHNSRRSHLAQIWSETAINYYNLKDINCYSGGTAVTALFPKIIETLEHQGFKIEEISKDKNPIYNIKSGENEIPIIGFSKRYDSDFNPQSNFIAMMTCSEADQDCPIINGCKKRFSLNYQDPKLSDETEYQSQIYKERSLEIAREMFYVFQKIKKS